MESQPQNPDFRNYPENFNPLFTDEFFLPALYKKLGMVKSLY